MIHLFDQTKGLAAHARMPAGTQHSLLTTDDDRREAQAELEARRAKEREYERVRNIARRQRIRERQALERERMLQILRGPMCTG